MKTAGANTTGTETIRNDTYEKNDKCFHHVIGDLSSLRLPAGGQAPRDDCDHVPATQHYDLSSWFIVFLTSFNPIAPGLFITRNSYVLPGSKPLSFLKASLTSRLILFLSVAKCTIFFGTEIKRLNDLFGLTLFWTFRESQSVTSATPAPLLSHHLFATIAKRSKAAFTAKQAVVEPSKAL